MLIIQRKSFQAGRYGVWTDVKVVKTIAGALEWLKKHRDPDESEWDTAARTFRKELLDDELGKSGESEGSKSGSG